MSKFWQCYLDWLKYTVVECMNIKCIIYSTCKPSYFTSLVAFWNCSSYHSGISLFLMTFPFDQKAIYYFLCTPGLLLCASAPPLSVIWKEDFSKLKMFYRLMHAVHDSSSSGLKPWNEVANWEKITFHFTLFNKHSVLKDSFYGSSVTTPTGVLSVNSVWDFPHQSTVNIL